MHKHSGLGQKSTKGISGKSFILEMCAFNGFHVLAVHTFEIKQKCNAHSGYYLDINILESKYLNMLNMAIF